MMNEASPSPVGALLKQWRERRRLSQLALANEAEISSRHLSFVETGRSHPSREMVLLLAEVLDVPPRAQNDLLSAAGYVPIYRESGLDAPGMAQFRRALDFILRQQEPYPALVLDRYWNILMANGGADRLFGYLLDPVVVAALGSPNAVRLVCHPKALRPWIVNWEPTAGALIQWLHRDFLRTADDGMRLFLDELLAYPDVPRTWRMFDLDAPTTPFLAIDMSKDDTHFRFFTTLTTLGTPYDITLHEMRVESFFPADDATDVAIRKLGLS